MTALAVTRTRHRLLPDPRRVLARPFISGEEILLSGPSRVGGLVARVMEIPEADVGAQVAAIVAAFAPRHRDYVELLEHHFRMVAHHVASTELLSRDRRRLIGAYFTHEYSVEAAALFNPSIVLAPDQRDLRPDQRRFVMSLRAVGEGHLSSIEFRSGVVDTTGELVFEPPSKVLVGGRRTPPNKYDRHLFTMKLSELGAGSELAWSVMTRLPEQFTLGELEASLAVLEADEPHAIHFETSKIIRVLASSNYVTTFPADSLLGERVIFPAGPVETRGMEDARFVRFTDDDGASTYYATYTAYDGFEILPQLIQTDDFVTFAISTLNGTAAQNKGMALFPRRIDGKYVMLSRKDRENLFLATSDNVRFWNDAVELYRPSQPWELLNIGNCGSPLETAAGWLVITHGAGPMRQYALGALLLDLDDPRKVIGELRDPLLVPDRSERDGYVPNVVYTCGAMIAGDVVVLPYGFADAGVGIALISLPELLARLQARA